MRIDILTLFPGMFTGPFQESIIKRALERGLVHIFIHDIRNYAQGKHRVVDDYPYGGGAGMVMKPEPIFAAVEVVQEEIHRWNEARGLGISPLTDTSRVPIVLLTPQGRLLDQRVVKELASHDSLIFLCGHYEGVDERVREHLVTDEISIGDYVLTGGEIAALVVIDAVVRLIPQVLGSSESLGEDSHSGGLLEYPQYTRPAEFKGLVVPPVLLSGNHATIAKWRREQSLLRTLRRRPELLEKAALTEEDKRFLEEYQC